MSFNERVKGVGLRDYQKAAIDDISNAVADGRVSARLPVDAGKLEGRSGHNKPPVVVEFSADEAKFLSESLSASMLAQMQIVQLRGKKDDVAIKAIAECEIMRGIRNKIEAAK